jgi:hypothetical protein
MKQGNWWRPSQRSSQRLKPICNCSPKSNEHVQ